MSYLIAVLIGAVIGAVGWFVLRERQSNAIWLAPALGIAGALLASVLAAVFGKTAAYGWWEATLQVVLAAVAVGALAFMAMRKGSGSSTGTAR